MIWINIDSGLKCNAETQHEAYFKILKMRSNRGYSELLPANDVMKYSRTGINNNAAHNYSKEKFYGRG